MRLLLVLEQYDGASNGNTISARRLANEMMKRGHQVRIAAAGETRVNEKYGFKELSIPGFNKIIEKQGFVFATPNKKLMRKAIAWADIVHVMMPFVLSKKAIRVARELHKPVTGAYHVQPENITSSIGLGKNKLVNKFIYCINRKTVFKYINKVHCPSNMIANQLKNNKYKNEIRVISNGIDDDFYNLERHEDDNELFTILMVGRFSKEKRQDILIDAVMKSKYSDKIQLVLAGKGPLESKYQKHSSGLPNKIIMRFYDKPDLLDLLSRTNLYVHCSDAEIEAMSCMEAFASGIVPIIANSEISATPQFAIDDRSLFEAGNSDDLKEKIEYWYENNEERKKMAKEYIVHAEKYRLSSSIDKMEKMFKDELREFHESGW